MVLEAGVDRAGQHADLGRRRGIGGQQRGEPAGPHVDVVVDEHEQVRGRGVDPRVAGGVQAARALVGDVARAVALRGRPRGVVGPVVDDEQLGARGGGLGGDRRQRHVEIARAPARRDDDARRRLHVAPESRFAALAAGRGLHARLAVAPAAAWRGGPSRLHL